MLLAKGMRVESKVLRELVQIGPDEHNPFGREKIPTSKEGLV